MMSQEELLPWSDPDTRFFADNLLGVEDWGDSIADIKFDPNEVLLGDKDVEMTGNNEDLSELLTSLGDDMWAISESLGAQIKQEPASPSSSILSYSSMDSSLPSSPESQMLLNGQSSPPHNPSMQDVKPLYFTPNSIKSEPARSVAASSCVKTQPTVTKNSCIKTEASLTPSACIKKEPIHIQPCSLVKPNGIVIQKGQISPTGAVGVVPTSSIKYIPVSNGVPTTAIIVGNKPGLPTVPKPITTAVANCLAGGTQPKVLDDKVVRRQQRMIKNRESACLSRKKKKEYLQTLENQVKEVNIINDQLIEENRHLKRRVQDLESENNILKTRNPELAATIKKSTCVLAVVFLVALNVGPFNSLKEQWRFGGNELMSNPVLRHGRALLQYKGEEPKEVQPLVYYGPAVKPPPNESHDALDTSTTKRTGATIFTKRKESKDLIVVKKKWDLLADVNKKRALLKKKERKFRNIRKRMNNKLNRSTKDVAMVCPSLQVNTTEASRLNEAIEAWIRRYEVERSVTQKKRKKEPEKVKSAVRNIAFRLTSNCTAAEAKRRIHRHMFTRRHNGASTPSSNTDNAVQLFQGRDLFKLFSEAINRQDDTFYIVSFRRDHLLFPATTTNTTQRPKMSLMMMAPPNGTLNGTTKEEDSISMMQIDCEILDTKHIKVKKSSLPVPFYDAPLTSVPQPFTST